MNHKRITITFTDGTEKIIAVDAVNGVRVSDGVAHFGRTDTTRWYELLAAPLCNIKYWG
jgi:hypothetical protein